MRSISRAMQDAYRKHETDWILPNGRHVQIVAYRDALEIAQKADKEIAELRMKLELIEAGV